MYAISNQHQTAIIEMAVASGLDLLKKMKEIHFTHLHMELDNSLIMHFIMVLKNHLRHWRKRNE